MQKKKKVIWVNNYQNIKRDKPRMHNYRPRNFKKEELKKKTNRKRLIFCKKTKSKDKNNLKTRQTLTNRISHQPSKKIICRVQHFRTLHLKT